MTLDDSRRLTGPSLLLDQPGAILEVHLEEASADGVIDAWRRQLQRYLEAVGWTDAATAVRRYPGGASLAFSAPLDALYAATEVNEAAWAAAVAEQRGGESPRFEAEAERLNALIADERNPALLALRDAAEAHDVTFLWDDDEASAGLGVGSRTWPVTALPSPTTLDWATIRDVPVALVTGTNGKSTTVRLLGTILRAAGHTPGLTSTDRIVVGDEILDEGDYSGPGGARTALRDRRVEVGVLEVARGGVLRRGLGMHRATAVAVTNVAADHLGDYGIETVEELARVKFVLTKALRPGGTLVVNAEDEHCRREARRVAPMLASRSVRRVWTALDPGDAHLQAGLQEGDGACAVVDDHLAYHADGAWTPVLAVADMPIAMGGAARYNVRNGLTALALARALGIGDAAIAEGLRQFRSDPNTNPGRGNIFEVRGARAWVDFAHNEHGLAALIETVQGLPARRRLVLVSHAGDRTEAELNGVAHAVAALRADCYLLPDQPDHLRGRSPGEIPALIRQGLLAEGIPAARIETLPDTLSAVRRALAWAQPGDFLLLQILSGRAEALDLLRAAAA